MFYTLWQKLTAPAAGRSGENDAHMSAPQKSKPNNLLKAHGPTGWLIVRLQRYALLGWALFFAMLLFHMFIVTVSTLAPKPVVAVDAGGRVLGNLEYLTPSARSDEELIAGAMYYLSHYLSMNSGTIYDDYAIAMAMQGDELRQRTIAAIKEDGYLGRVENAKMTGRVEFFYKDDTKPEIVARKDLQAVVRLRGNIIFAAGKSEDRKPFDITLTMTATPRTMRSTHGLRIDDQKDN